MSSPRCLISCLSEGRNKGGVMLSAVPRGWRWVPAASSLVRPPTRCRPVVCCSSADNKRLRPPDVAALTETARITLSPQEVEAFAPKIRQVVDWFGQLQGVNLESYEPSLRADTEGGANSREDLPEMFERREEILEAVPNYEDPYVKVPKVLNVE